MRASYIFAILLTTAAGPCAAAGQLPAPNHPILGTWRIAVLDGSCSETYRFRPDGTILVTSGEETAEMEYEISVLPSVNGFYRWSHRNVGGNGKKDCAGNVAELRSEATWFVRFDQSKDLLIVCTEESVNACFGPLRRVHGQDP